MFAAANAFGPIFAVLMVFYTFVPPASAVIYKADCFLGNNCVQQRTQKHHHKLCFYPDANGASPPPCEDPLLRKIALSHVNPKPKLPSIAYYNLASKYVGGAETYEVDPEGGPVVLCLSGYKQEKVYSTYCRLAYSNNDVKNATAWNSACGMEHIDGRRVQNDQCDGKAPLDSLGVALAVFAFFSVPALLFQYIEFGLKTRYWFRQRRKMRAAEDTTPNQPMPAETSGNLPKMPMAASPCTSLIPFPSPIATPSVKNGVGACGSCVGGALRERHPIIAALPSPDATLVAEIVPEDAVKIMPEFDITMALYISEQLTEEPAAMI